MENQTETPQHMEQSAKQQTTPSAPPKPVKEEVLFEWESPERPFKKRDREYYTTIGIIVFLLSVILFFAGQFLPIAVVIAFAFLSYSLASVPPGKTKHQITTFGIRSSGVLYPWEMLGRFWFSSRFQQDILNIEHNHAVIKKIQLMVGTADKKEIEKHLADYLVNEVPAPTWLDRSATWLQEKFPLEKN